MPSEEEGNVAASAVPHKDCLPGEAMLSLVYRVTLEQEQL
jgi:hypothetical protein